jgi:response regulator RpfG family c-di-GMP phosphodiesterase
MALDQRPDLTFVPGPPPIMQDDGDAGGQTGNLVDGIAAYRAAAPFGLPYSSLPVPPLRPLGRDWLQIRSAQLDPRRHGAIADISIVSTIVREGGAAGSPGWRFVAPATPSRTDRNNGADTNRRVAAPAARGKVLSGTRTEARPETAVSEAPAPRSMGVPPMLAYGLARRTAEVLAVLSACLDPAEGRPVGHAVRVAYLASRLAAELELGDDARSDLLYAGLLRDAGSTGPLPDQHAPADGGRSRARGLGRGRHSTEGATAPLTAPQHLSQRDRAAALVRVLGLPHGVLEAVASAEERWDGRGPRRERRTAVPTGARVLSVAVLAATAAAGEGATDATIERTLRRERGRTLDPELVDRAVSLGRSGLWAELGSSALLERALELEPLHRLRQADDAGLDAITGAFADLVDTRTPVIGRHGRRVADIAARTSVALGLEPRVADDVRRAALLHDIGKLLVPIAYLERPDQLTEQERQVVDGHARAGAAVLERSHVLGGLAPLIEGHHEPLDGTGRFPAMIDDDRELGARIIALSDRFESMTTGRPWLPAKAPAQVWQELREQASEPLCGVVLRIMERTIGEG